MPISQKHKMIFIHVPKNAGTSIINAFDFCDIPGHVPWMWFRDHVPELWFDYISFGVVRNPWDRAVSCYEYAKMKSSYWHDTNNKHEDHDLISQMTFTECVMTLKSNPEKFKHLGWKSQHHWIMKDGQQQVDFVVKFESLKQDISRLGLNGDAIKHDNKSPNTNYRSYYTPETKQLIGQIYKQDIEFFNYNY